MVFFHVLVYFESGMGLILNDLTWNGEDLSPVLLGKVQIHRYLFFTETRLKYGYEETVIEKF